MERKSRRAKLETMAEGEYPILALPAGEVVPLVEKTKPRGGSPNPSRERQIERLEPQFLALQKVLDARNAELATSALGAAPEHVLVFETNGPPDAFFDEVSKHPELEWLLEYEDRVPADEDFKAKAPKKPRQVNTEQILTSFVYMVMFNQTALQQLLSYWKTYKETERMPRGLGAWSRVFRCLRAIRRWGPQDRLRELGVLEDLLESADPSRRVPVEIELWPRSTEQRARTQARIREAVEDSGGVVLDTVATPEIHYHAMLVELPHGELGALLRQDVEWLQIDDIYLIRPTPQCSTISDSPDVAAGPVTGAAERAEGEPIVAMLDGLPMENHPYLQGRLMVDDPDGWAATYQVAERKHGTAVASLLMRGQELGGSALLRPVYVRPIMRPDRDGLGGVSERPPRDRLWLDVIHQAVRRMLATDVPGGPVAPTVKIINLSIGDNGRPFLSEMSPLARLLDWLSWKYRVLFVVSAGNHGDDLPHGCDDDAQLLQYLFEQRRHRRLLSPGESLNSITVGAVGVDGSNSALPPNALPMPTRADLPAAYSALGRGHRRSVKPDVLVAGGRQLYRQARPMPDAPWTTLTRQDVGQLVATPSSATSRPTTRWSGTSCAAALTSRTAALYAAVVEDVIARGGNGGWLSGVPTAVLLKALLVHTAEWRIEGFEFARQALSDWLVPGRAKDDLSGLFGYGVLREDRGLACSPDRATAIGGGHLAKEMRIRHRVPIPASLHLFNSWRRVTVTLAWLSPINSANRKYRVAQLGLELPKDKSTPLGVKSSQVHTDASGRGTVQHFILERLGRAMNVGDDDEFEFFVTCAEDGGTLQEPVPYGLAVTLEVAPETGLPIYQQVRDRIEQRVAIPAAVR